MSASSSLTASNSGLLCSMVGISTSSPMYWMRSIGLTTHAVPVPNSSSNCANEKKIKYSYENNMLQRRLFGAYPFLAHQLHDVRHREGSFDHLEFAPLSRQLQNRVAGNARQNETAQWRCAQFSLWFSVMIRLVFSDI